MANAINVNKHTKEIKSKRRLNAKTLERDEEMLNRDEILVAGGENRTKAIKEIQREQAEEKKAKDQRDADFLTSLEQKRKFHDSYKRTLASALSELLEGLDWIEGWQGYVLSTDGSPISIKGKPFGTKDGILLIIITPDDRVFHQGILSTGEPLLDYAALYTMAAQAENQMDNERGLLLTGDKQEEASDDKILDMYGKPIKAD